MDLGLEGAFRDRNTSDAARLCSLSAWRVSLVKAVIQERTTKVVSLYRAN